jgi:hypothetical protein
LMLNNGNYRGAALMLLQPSHTIGRVITLYSKRKLPDYAAHIGVDLTKPDTETTEHRWKR